MVQPQTAAYRDIILNGLTQDRMRRQNCSGISSWGEASLHLLPGGRRGPDCVAEESSDLLSVRSQRLRAVRRDYAASRVLPDANRAINPGTSCTRHSRGSRLRTVADRVWQREFAKDAHPYRSDTFATTGTPLRSDRHFDGVLEGFSPPTSI